MGLMSVGAHQCHQCRRTETAEIWISRFRFPEQIVSWGSTSAGISRGRALVVLVDPLHSFAKDSGFLQQ